MRLIYYGDTLQHHGIKGQRWGIRRFQPYPKGHTGGKEVGKAAKTKPQMSEDAKKARELQKRPVYELSNNELRDLNTRVQLEQNYKQLNPNRVKRGMAVAGTIAASMGTVIALYQNSEKIIKIGKNIVKKSKK